MTTAQTTFAPRAVEAMNRAYDEACAILRAEGADYSARVKAGERIMFLARNGETDVRTLCGTAVEEALGRRPRGLDL